MAKLKAAVLRIAACVLARLVGDDLRKTADVAMLEAERNAANQAPTSRQETANQLNEGRF